MKIHPYHTETERLILRSPTLDDYEAWKAGHLSVKPPQNVYDKIPRCEKDLEPDCFDRLLHFLHSNSRIDSSYAFFVFRKSDQRWVATVTLFDVLRMTQQMAWMGYHVLNPYWGQGYATEAVSAIFPVAFQQIKLHRIEVLTEMENVISQRVAEKVGMRWEGISHRRVWQRGQWRDVRIYALTLEEWLDRFSERFEIGDELLLLQVGEE